MDLRSNSDRSSYLPSFGGSPLNTAVGLAKLGVPVSFLGRLGNDDFASELFQYLIDSGVDTSLVIRVDQPTSIAKVTHTPDGLNNYEFEFDSTSNFGWEKEDFPHLVTDWFHFGSLVYVIDPGATNLLRFIEKQKCGLSVDLNIRPNVEPNRERYLRQVDHALRLVGARKGIVKLSMEDLLWIRPEFEDDFSQVLSLLQEWIGNYGIDLVILTMGEFGALAAQAGGIITRVTGFPATEIDTIGAGDAFMAGFLAIWLPSKTDLRLALRYGNAVAALTCEREGANPPSSEEVEKYLLSMAK